MNIEQLLDLNDNYVAPKTEFQLWNEQGDAMGDELECALECEANCERVQTEKQVIETANEITNVIEFRNKPKTDEEYEMGQFELTMLGVNTTHLDADTDFERLLKVKGFANELADSIQRNQTYDPFSAVLGVRQLQEETLTELSVKAYYAFAIELVKLEDELQREARLAA